MKMHKLKVKNHLYLKLRLYGCSDVVLKTGLKTNFLRSWSWPKRLWPWSWSWPWTVLRIWKIAVLRPKTFGLKTFFRSKRS